MAIGPEFDIAGYFTVKEAQVAEVMRLADEYADDVIGHQVNAVSRVALEAAVRKLAGLTQTADSETAAPPGTE